MKKKYTAVITGGSTGIGACLAKRMLDEDYSVITVDKVAPDFTNDGLTHVKLDLTMDENVISRAARKIAKDNQVTHYIHNVDFGKLRQIERTRAAEIGELTHLHIGSALTMMQAFLPSMRRNKFGRVIFNSARAALGVATHTAYSASKSGMIGMARTWALELGRYRITVNVVAPGPIKDESFLKDVEKGSELEFDLANRVPIGRLGTDEDVTNAFMFFADERSGFITGQTLYVCGGTSVGAASL